MQTTIDMRLAVLIDADNVPVKYIKGMIEEIARYGTPTIKRIYGDWTKPNLNSWKTVLLENAITPIQQYSYTTGKNSTDSAMIIDAMDTLYSGNVDGFCIVSSDSDFTRLAVRLRESGKRVIGLGEKKTPNSFIVACDKFIYMEVLKTASSSISSIAAISPISSVKPSERHTVRPSRITDAKKPSLKTEAAEKAKAADTMPAEDAVSKVEPIAQIIAIEAVEPVEKAADDVKKLIASTVEDLADDNGWAFLGDVGNLLIKKKPDFDPRVFGFNKLTPLIKSLDTFDIDIRDTNQPNIKHIYIRNH